MVFKAPSNPNCDSMIQWASQGTHSSSISVVNANLIPSGIKFKRHIPGVEGAR